MQRRYITVDVFTDRAFGGNPLAVVLDAGGLSTAQMQAIATEFNYSETTFVLPPRDRRPRRAGSHLHREQGDTVRRPSQCRHRLRAGDAGGEAAGAAVVRGAGGAGAGRDPDRAGQGRRRRTHRAAAAEAAVASWRRTGRGLPFAVGERCEDRPASAADHLGRAVVPGGRTRLARGVAAGKARCRGVRQNLPVRRQRRGLFLYARCAGERKAMRTAGADVPSGRERHCPKTPPPAARRRRQRRCSPISTPPAMAN